MKIFLEQKILFPQPELWRWLEIVVVVIGVLNSASAAIVIIRTRIEQEKYIGAFLKNSDFISLVVIKYWVVYILVALCGVVLAWFIHKTKELPLVFGFSISIVYLLCALWMTFSSVYVMTQLEKLANA